MHLFIKPCSILLKQVSGKDTIYFFVMMLSLSATVPLLSSDIENEDPSFQRKHGIDFQDEQDLANACKLAQDLMEVSIDVAMSVFQNNSKIKSRWKKCQIKKKMAECGPSLTPISAPLPALNALKPIEQKEESCYAGSPLSPYAQEYYPQGKTTSAHKTENNDKANVCSKKQHKKDKSCSKHGLEKLKSIQSLNNSKPIVAHDAHLHAQAVAFSPVGAASFSANVVLSVDSKRLQLQGNSATPSWLKALKHTPCNTHRRPKAKLA